MYCKRCGARVQQGIATCPECGARQTVRVKTVRCAHCHGRAAADLSMCPHCGRDLHPAGLHWGLVVGAVALVALAGFWGLGRLPVDKVRETALSARDNAQSLAQILDAVAPVSPADQLALAAEPPTPELLAAAPEATATPTPTPTVTPTLAEPVAAETISDTVPAAEATPVVDVATLTPEPTVAAEESASYTVRSGDSLMSIGAQLGIDWQEIARVNSLNAGSMLRIGQKLRLPEPTAAPTATAVPTATPAPTATETPPPTSPPTATVPPTPTRRSNVRATATATQPPPTATNAPTPTQPPPTATPAALASGGTTTYRIRSGDSLSSIGARFGIPWQSIAAANKLTGSSRLQVGQELIIPLSGAVPPTATPTRRPAATATTTPAATQPPAPVQLLPAPVLDNPGDQTPFQGDRTMIVLNWKPILGMPPEAQYEVAVRWTQGGAPQETTLLTTANEVRFPPWLWSKADQPDRKYTWQVRAVKSATDGQGGLVVTPISASSPVRTLTWN